jgi:tetratricopeptide (TPR) repeat protein
MDNDYRWAIRALEQGDHATALKLFRAMLESEPDNWKVHHHLGLIGRIRGDWDMAIRHFSAAIDLGSDSFGTHYTLGIAYQHKQEYAQAIEQLKIAHQLNPQSVEVINSLGLTYRLMGDTQEAIRVYKFAIQQLMDNIHHRLEQAGTPLLTRALTDKGKSIGMLNPLAMARVPVELKKDILYSILQNNLGVCYEAEGLPEKARAAYRESIAFIPEGMEYPPPFENLERLGEAE